jgi:tetratricopeptide (TPR) repeat protein
MRLFKFILVLFLANNLMVFSQYNCLDHKQLNRMTSTNIEDIRSFLINENWDNSITPDDVNEKYFKYNINYNATIWEKNYNGFYSKLLVLNKSNKPNIVVLETDEDCFKSLLIELANKFPVKSIETDDYSSKTVLDGLTKIELRKSKNYSDQFSILYYNFQSLAKDLLLAKKEKEKLDKIENEKRTKITAVENEVTELVAQNNFDEAINKYESILSISTTDDQIETKISSLLNQKREFYINKGDDAYQEYEFENAINFYELALNQTQKDDVVFKKIADCRNRIKNNIINQKTKEAKSLFEEKRFLLALGKYKEVLELDENDKNAKNQINEINETLELLETRKTKVYSYKSIIPYEFSKISNLILTNLNNYTSYNSSGIQNFSFNLNFDTIGKNESFYKINTSTTPSTLSSDLIYLKNLTLSPPSLKGFYVKSKDEFNIDLSWSTNNVKFKSNHKITKQIKGEKCSSSSIYKFINSQDYEYGIFTFEVKNKILNSTKYSDINLVDYRNNTGVSAVFYSMLLPGWGTLKATQGQKGVGRMVAYIISTGLGALNLSNALRDTQPTTTISNSMITSYVFFGIASTIYVYDFFHVFIRGCKNNAKSRELNRQLKRGPIEVEKENFENL